MSNILELLKELKDTKTQLDKEIEEKYQAYLDAVNQKNELMQLLGGQSQTTVKPPINVQNTANNTVFNDSKKDDYGFSSLSTSEKETKLNELKKEAGNVVAKMTAMLDADLNANNVTVLGTNKKMIDTEMTPEYQALRKRTTLIEKQIRVLEDLLFEEQHKNDPKKGK